MVDLSKFLTPSPPKNMELALRQETKEEDIKPGLRVIRGQTPGQNILLNATYNNYTITNRYVEGSNSVLKKENRDLVKELADCKKKYQNSKKLLSDAAQLVALLTPNKLDVKTRLKLVEFNTKWEQRCKRKKEKHDEEQEEEEEAHIKKKQKCGPK